LSAPEEPAPSGLIDYGSPTANMYGCEPCPKCGAEYRAPYGSETATTIECDDCGHVEPGRWREGSFA
jgi:hypothetical protein